MYETKKGNYWGRVILRQLSRHYQLKQSDCQPKGEKGVNDKYTYRFCWVFITKTFSVTHNQNRQTNHSNCNQTHSTNI